MEIKLDTNPWRDQLDLSSAGGFDEVLADLNVPLLDLSKLSGEGGVFEGFGFQNLQWLSFASVHLGFDQQEETRMQNALGVIHTQGPSFDIAGVVGANTDSPIPLGISYVTQLPTHSHNGELSKLCITVNKDLLLSAGLDASRFADRSIGGTPELDMSQNSMITRGMLTVSQITKPKIIKFFSTASNLVDLRLDQYYRDDDFKALQALGIPARRLSTHGDIRVITLEEQLSGQYPKDLTVQIRGNNIDVPTNIKAS